MTSRLNTTRLLTGSLLLALLAGCGAENEELQEWMERQRREVKPNVSPLSPPKKFEAQPYSSAQAVEPFSNQKLTVALKLEGMSMVGSVAKQAQPFALLRVDNLLYQVKPGEYIGQNYGRITKITETQIVLREIVQDAAGEWIERASTLQLQEKAR
jgi:type IV pilus assembly protein PilP